VATSQPRGVQSGLNLIVKLLQVEKDVALTRLVLMDACALRPIALTEGIQRWGSSGTGTLRLQSRVV
jgi:hypothetical protein